MLNDDELRIGLVLRAHVGWDKKGVGPDVDQLLKIFPEEEPEDVRRILNSMARRGLVHVETRIGAPRPGVPNAFRDVAGVTILERLQQLLDEFDPQE